MGNFLKKYWWAVLLVGVLIYFIWKWNQEKNKKAEVKEVVKETWKPTIKINPIPQSTVNVAQTHVTPSQTQADAFAPAGNGAAQEMGGETVYGTAGGGQFYTQEEIDEWGEDVVCSRSITGRLTCNWV